MCSQWAIVGHSERRQYQGESSELVAAKAKMNIPCGVNADGESDLWIAQGVCAADGCLCGRKTRATPALDTFVSYYWLVVRRSLLRKE